MLGFFSESNHKCLKSYTSLSYFQKKEEVGAAMKIASDSLLLYFDDSADAAVMENIGWRLKKRRGEGEE